MTAELATKLELQEAKEDIRYTLRNEFTPMIHWLADSIDSVKWMLTKLTVSDAKQKVQIKNLEKAISSHTTTEDKDMGEVVSAIKELTKSISRMNEKLEWKISFTMFWTLMWAAAWAIVITTSLLFSDIKEDRKEDKITRESLIRVETLVEWLKSKSK